jgi:hypothetical protein
VLVSVQDMSVVCVKHTIGSEITLVRFVSNVPQAPKSCQTHPMELLGDAGHVESHFSLLENSVNVSTRFMHGLCRTYHGLRNCFGRTW